MIMYVDLDNDNDVKNNDDNDIKDNSNDAEKIAADKRNKKDEDK